MSSSLHGYFSFKPSLLIDGVEFNKGAFYIGKEEGIYKIFPLCDENHESNVPQGSGLPYLVINKSIFCEKTLDSFLELDAIFLAHEYFFLEGRAITYKEGMAGIYAIRQNAASKRVLPASFPIVGDLPSCDMPSFLNLTCGNRFVYDMFTFFKYRCAIANMFTKSLKSSRGKFPVRFSLRSTFEEFIKFGRLIPDFDARCSHRSSMNRVVSVVPAGNKPIRGDHIKKDLLVVEIYSVTLLFTAIGSEYWHYPITVKVGDRPSNPSELSHAAIPYHNSRIFIIFDLLSDELTVKAPVYQIDDIKKVNSVIKQRMDELAQLTTSLFGKVFRDVDDRSYEVVCVEDNSTDFCAADHKKRNRKGIPETVGIIVVWLLDVTPRLRGESMRSAPDDILGEVDGTGITAAVLEPLEADVELEHRRSTCRSDASQRQIFCYPLDPTDFDVENLCIICDEASPTPIAEHDINDEVLSLSACTEFTCTAASAGASAALGTTKRRRTHGNESLDITTAMDDYTEVLPAKTREPLQAQFTTRIMDRLNETCSDEAWSGLSACSKHIFYCIRAESVQHSPQFKMRLTVELDLYRISDIRTCVGTLFAIDSKVLIERFGHITMRRSYVTAIVDYLFTEVI